MKIFYQSVFVLSVSVFVLLSFMSIALPSDAAFATRMADHPDAWDLQFSSSGKNFFPETNSEAKTKLISFIGENRHSYLGEVRWIFIGLCVSAAFSLLGWIREKTLESRSPQIQSPSSGRNAVQ